MAFDSGTNRLIRPSELVALLGFNSASRSGFQGVLEERQSTKD